MSRNPNTTRAKSGSVRPPTGFEKEYKEVRDLNAASLKLLTNKQSELETRMRILMKRKLADILENQAEISSMETETVGARKLLMATTKYVTVDLKPTLTRLGETAGKYAVLVQKKLNEEFEHGYGVNVEKFLAMVKETEAMQDFAKQLNITIAEMDSELRLAVVYIMSAERDMNAFNEIIQGRIGKEKEAQRQREEEQKRLEEENKRRKEEAKLRKEEEAKRRKEEEERRKREAEEKERQRKEEEKRKRIEEEERRRQEEELEKQRKEEEERKRIEEEERRRQDEELERHRKEEEERRRKLEEEARREEEKRRILEEERKRKEEEEKRRLAEEERKRREDPRNWTNVLVYNVEGDRDALGHGIACVIRVPDDVTLDKRHLTCTVLDASVSRYLLEENEEVVSNTVNIRLSDPSKALSFPSALWIAFPYCATAKSREQFIKTQDLGSATTPWIEAHTRDASIQPGKVKENIRFVETALRHLSSEGINVVVVSKSKTDRQTFNSKGGQLRSTVDPRISVTVPKNAFKTPTPLAIQAIPVDSAVLRERYDGCDHLLGTSPLVLLHCQDDPLKPLTLSITNPSGSGRRSRPKTALNDRRSTGGQFLRPHTSLASREDDLGENNEKDFLNLVTRDKNGRWRARDDISLDIQKESTVFEMSTPAERLLLLRTKELLQGSELIKIAQNYEDSLQDRLVSILLRQNPSSPNNIYMECCKREVASKRIQSLLENHLTEGPIPNQVLFKEGDLLEVSFTGNIHFEDKVPRLLTYHSNLVSPKFSAGIKEVDVFSQNALEQYRGTVRLRLVERPYKPPAKFLATTDINKNRPIAATVDSGLVCEFPIILPKPPKEVNRAKKVHLPLATQGPLADDYFDHLSEELGEEWKLLASRLRFSPASVERIAADHAHLRIPEATQRSARQMISEWFRSSVRATDKAEKLELALASAGRTDLAEELNNLNRKFKEESEKKQRSAHLIKCIKAYTESQAAVTEWRSVGQALGLRSEDLEAIGQSQTEGIREQARTMLMRWIEVRGEKATKELLIRCLKKLNLNEAVGKLKLVI